MSNILDTTTKSIEVLLSAAAATTQLDLTASWVDYTTTATTPGSNDTVTNGATAVTLVAAPSGSTQRHVLTMSIYNIDTQITRVTVRLNNNGTYRNLCVIDLFPQETLFYSMQEGFYVCDASGMIKHQDGFQRTGSILNLAHAGGSGITANTIAGCVDGTALTTLNMSDNLYMAMPFVAPARFSVINRIALFATAGGSAGGANVRMGIYTSTSESNLYPDALVVDGGEVNIASAAANAIIAATLNTALIPGKLYWAVFNIDVLGGTPVIRGIAVGGCYPIFGLADALSATTPQIGLSGSRTYAALPAAFTASIAALTTTAPAIFLRFSA